MKLYGNIPVFGEADPGALKQIYTCAKDADFCALMADHHQGYAVPIGGVVAYRDKISPAGVGYDIACGNKAVRLDITGGEARRNIKIIMDNIWRTISFGVGRKNNEDVDHDLFSHDFFKTIPILRQLRDKARSQLGTVGSGNHYVDIFVDELDRVWIGVHFGSRGLGHGIATHYLKAGGAKDGIFVEPLILDVASDLGDEYLNAMFIAGQYAYAGRDWVCDRVAKLLGGTILEAVHNHHNFAWRESHHGDYYWVVRKGATPAFPGQRGFVGGSMGENAVIIEGTEMAYASHTFCSTVHGAGRVMGRMEARGKVKNGVVVRQGKVTPEMMRAWLDRAGVELRGGGLDESPDCYKRLPDVLAEHASSIRIVHTLKPLGVAMARSEEFDPYKD